MVKMKVTATPILPPLVQFQHELTISPARQLRIKDRRLDLYRLCYPPGIVPGPVLGIDPGSAKLGFTFLYPEGGDVWQIQLTTSATMPERLRRLYDFAAWLTGFYPNLTQACIEYAAHGYKFGQVSLAETRSAFTLALLDQHIPVVTAPPQTLRKAICGKGTIHAEELIPVLPSDAAASLTCALYCLGRH